MAIIRTIISLLACLPILAHAQPMVQAELAWGIQVATTFAPAAPTSIIPAINHDLVSVGVNVLTNQVVSWTASTGTQPITYWVYGSVTNGFTANATSLLASGLSRLKYTNVFNMQNITNYYYIIEASNLLGAVYSAQVNLQQLIPLMIDNITPSGVCTSLVNNSTAYIGMSFGYTGSTTLFWHANDNTLAQWLEYAFTTTPLVTSYAILDENPNGTSTFNLEGYDGATWHVLDTETENYSGNMTTAYVVPNPTTRYGSYRINFTTWTPNGVGFVNCAFQIFGIP